MLIKVTQEHIDKGRRRDVYSCPIALAIKSALPAHHVIVGPFNSHIDGITYELPRHVADFIIRFDYSVGDNIKPFEFQLGFVQL